MMQHVYATPGHSYLIHHHDRGTVENCPGQRHSVVDMSRATVRRKRNDDGSLVEPAKWIGHCPACDVTGLWDNVFGWIMAMKWANFHPFHCDPKPEVHRDR